MQVGLLLEEARSQLEEGVKRGQVRMGVRLELRTLSFWRALTAECIATFLFTLLVTVPTTLSAALHCRRSAWPSTE